jgi:hypothetical protein
MWNVSFWAADIVILRIQLTTVNCSKIAKLYPTACTKLNKSKTSTTFMCQLNFNWLFISIKICSTDNWSITDDVPFHIVVDDTTLYISLTS